MRWLAFLVTSLVLTLGGCGGPQAEENPERERRNVARARQAADAPQDPATGEQPGTPDESVPVDDPAAGAVPQSAWPEGSGYLTPPRNRPAELLAVTPTYGEAIIAGVSDGGFQMQGKIEIVNNRMLVFHPGKTITHGCPGEPSLEVTDCNGDKCTLLYGMSVKIDEYGQFRFLKYDPDAVAGDSPAEETPGDDTAPGNRSDDAGQSPPEESQENEANELDPETARRELLKAFGPLFTGKNLSCPIFLQQKSDAPGIDVMDMFGGGRSVSDADPDKYVKTTAAIDTDGLRDLLGLADPDPKAVLGGGGDWEAVWNGADWYFLSVPVKPVEGASPLTAEIRRRFNREPAEINVWLDRKNQLYVDVIRWK